MRNGGESSEIVKRPNVLAMTHLESPWGQVRSDLCWAFVPGQDVRVGPQCALLSLCQRRWSKLSLNFI